MLKTRIIPILLHSGPTLVKGKRFQSWRYVGSAMQAARLHETRGVDELMMLDVSATADRREPDYGMVRQLAEECYMPLTIGGGKIGRAHV